MADTDIMRILQQVRIGEIDQETAAAALKKAATTKEVTYAVSPKGAISFKGMRRFPITVYVEELETIVQLFGTDEFQQFLVENETSLSRKK